MSCGSLTPFSTYLHVTHKTRTRKHPQKSVFKRGDLPPFAEDGAGDNFSSRLQFRWSSSYTRHVFPSFSSCFLTQKKQGQPLRQHVVVLLRVMYVTWGGCSWLWVFFWKPCFFFCPPHHSTATASSFVAFLFLLSLLQATGQIESFERSLWETDGDNHIAPLSCALTYHCAWLSFLYTLHSRCTSLPAAFTTVYLQVSLSFFNHVGCSFY